MKLVVVTQVFDRRDAILGFVPRWIEGLAKCAERVRVVALELGDVSNLPSNVDLREIGRKGVLRRYLRFRAALKDSLGSDGFDCVLAHMVPRYALVAEPFARKFGASSNLWYTHGAVDDRLRRAVELCDKVFTATPESLRIASPKIVVTGHGVDVAHFDSKDEEPVDPPRILSVGRLTPSKDPLTVIAALAKLRGSGREVELDLVGGTLAAGDPEYRKSVERAIESLGLRAHVHLHGAVPYPDVPPHFRRASVVVNASSTGSLDKVVLEAMSCARPVISSNDAFPRLVAELGPEAREWTFAKGDAAMLSGRIEAALDRPRDRREALGVRLRTIVQRDHEVDRLMRRLVSEMERR